ncbi:MAG TPA: KamA family radical SAM protein [bacterium]|jgi:KamA family protein
MSINFETLTYTKEQIENRIADPALDRQEYVPTWQRRLESLGKVKYITKLTQIPQLSDEERARLEPIADKFVFRANTYYLSLIDWDDPDDPIRKIVIPDPEELFDDGEWDASNEHSITVAPGCEHKYARTALLLVTDICGSICRFCFRKRLFQKDNDEAKMEFGEAFDYIRAHPEIDTVLMTGGDSLIPATRKIAGMLEEIRSIPHVNTIRFGSKMLAFNPFRVLQDDELVDVMARYSSREKPVYVMAHFNHPREITLTSIEAIEKLQRAGIQIVNQSPLMTGVNDNAHVLGELFNLMQRLQIPQYYVFQCRPTKGNALYKTTMIDGLNIVEKAKSMANGLGKRARYAGSHVSGKIEILGYDDEWQYFKYHQSKDPKYYGQFFKLPRKDDAMWWDDWMEDGESFNLEGCKVVKLGSGTM